MCGHVGIAGDLSYRDEALMKRLLIFDYFRGIDSTGFAAVRNDGAVHIAKVASHPIDLFDMKKFQSALSAYTSTVFMGHNRAATRGVVNGLNAHPFRFGHIIGAHNGTLTADSWTKLDELSGEKSDVDSAAIFQCIEKIGIDDTIANLQGAWALVWVDLNEGTLNFLRNKERPFWFGYQKDLKSVMWASEWPILRGACDLAKKEDAYEMWRNEEGYSYFETEVDTLYQFDLLELMQGFEEVPEPRAREIKGREAPPKKPANDPFPAGHSQHKSGSGTTTSTTTSPGTTSHISTEPIHSIVEKTKPFGDYVTQEEFEHLAKYGCAWCGGDVDFHEEGVVVYKNQDAVICPDCSGVNSNRVYVPTAELAY